MSAVTFLFLKIIVLCFNSEFKKKKCFNSNHQRRSKYYSEKYSVNKNYLFQTVSFQQ